MTLIKFSIYRAFAILGKEFTQLKRDKLSLKMIIAIPIMQLILFGYALNNNPKHLPTALLLQDNSAITRSLIKAFENTEYFAFDYHIKSDEEGHKLLRNGSVLFVITIPNNFERDLIRGITPKILIEADATDPVAISGAISAAQGMLNTVLNEELKGEILSELSKKSDAIQIVKHQLYNPEGFTRYNIIPGLIAIILTMTGIMMTSLAMTREHENGTMENLLAMPILPLEVMIGKITPYIMIGFFQSVLIIAFAQILFRVPVMGSFGLLFFVIAIFITCNMALGFTISTIAKTQTQALQMSFMAMLPSIMLSGFLFPFLGMPNWAQKIGSIIPATHFIRISRSILLKGSNFYEILPSLMPLIIFMIIITLSAMRFYKKTLD